MFYPLFALALVGTVALGLRGGVARAVALGWVSTAFLFPFWLQIGLGTMFLDLRTGALLGVLVVAVLRPPEKMWQLTMADGLILTMILIQAITQHQAGLLRPLTLPEVARKWLGPYLAGRLLLTSAGDLALVIRGMAPVIAGLSVYAVSEALAKVNWINLALGRTFGLLEEGEGYRWGLKRAHATFDHPIYFGMALVLLLPWALEAARSARQGQGPRWWRWLPLGLAAALLATVSRGPQLAGIATIGLCAFFRFPKWRILMVSLTLGMGISVWVAKDEIVALLEVAAGEKAANAAPTLIMIEGEEVEYTGTNHRMLLFRVYDDAIRKAGLFGYGHELKGIVLEESIAQRFGSIDCHYLLFYLQTGLLGLAAFLILTLGTLLNLGRIALRGTPPFASLAASLFGSLASVAVLLMSVWFSPDFAGIWLFSAGLAGRLHLVKPDRPPPADETAAEQALTREPCPGELPLARTPLRTLPETRNHGRTLTPVAHHQSGQR